MSKYTTVSLPKPLLEDIKIVMAEIGYWISLSSFVREACIEKLHSERMKRLKEK